MEKGERHEFCIFEISRYQTSASRIKFISKEYSQSKTEKVNSTHDWILHIQISLDTKFQLKLKILIFWTKFAQNGYFQSKSEKMNTTIKFCIFKSVYVPNLSLNWKFLYFWQICPTKYFQLKNEKVNITNEFWIFELVPIPYFSLNWQFWFSGPNLSKRGTSRRKHKKLTPP